MLIKIIKSVFNFYMLCVQPLLGLFLVGYSVWKFSGDGICTADKVIACDISIYLKPAFYLLIGTVVLFVWYIAWQTERSKEEDFKSSRQPGGCGLSWPEITVIKTDNIIVFQLVIWPVQLNPVNENLPLKEANFPAMS